MASKKTEGQPWRVMGRKDDSISEAEHFLNKRQDVILKPGACFKQINFHPSWEPLSNGSSFGSPFERHYGRWIPWISTAPNPRVGSHSAWSSCCHGLASKRWHLSLRTSIPHQPAPAAQIYFDQTSGPDGTGGPRSINEHGDFSGTSANFHASAISLSTASTSRSVQLRVGTDFLNQQRLGKWVFSSDSWS